MSAKPKKTLEPTMTVHLTRAECIFLLEATRVASSGPSPFVRELEAKLQWTLKK
jgi:hypothetical protein